jgi:hypothetical protein
MRERWRARASEGEKEPDSSLSDGLNTVGASAVARVNDTESQRRGFIVGSCYPERDEK